MKLKTLKDLGESDYDVISRSAIKKEAIKWVNEEKELNLVVGAISLQTRRWMRRLDITEEDLK